MKETLSCNQAGRRFSGIEVEADPQPLTVKIVTPKGEFNVEVPPETVFSGIFPALRSFILSQADDLGVTVTNDGSGRKSGRVKLKEAPAKGAEEGEEPQGNSEPSDIEGSGEVSIKKKK